VKTCAVLTPETRAKFRPSYSAGSRASNSTLGLRRKLSFRCRCDPLTIQGCHRSLARCKPRRRQLNLFPLLEAFLRSFHQRPESGSRDHFGDNLGHPFGMVEMDPVSAVAHHQMSPA
jgi:hypothetical protein